MDEVERDIENYQGRGLAVGVHRMVLFTIRPDTGYAGY